MGAGSIIWGIGDRTQAGPSSEQLVELHHRLIRRGHAFIQQRLDVCVYSRQRLGYFVREDEQIRILTVPHNFGSNHLSHF